MRPAISDKGKSLSGELVVVCSDEPFLFGNLCLGTPYEDFVVSGFGYLFHSCIIISSFRSSCEGLCSESLDPNTHLESHASVSFLSMAPASSIRNCS